jgi:predicted AlkP superfamily pyrophosphatase or phosphodiesterase
MVKRNQLFILSIIFTFLLLTQGCKQSTSTPTYTESNKTPQSQITNTAIPTPSAVPKHSLVLISLDAARADLVYGLMDDGIMPTISSLVEDGVRAEYAQTVDPSLTATAHNSISSGSYPRHTGITSNSFHVAGDDFYWYRVGFEEPMDDAEPIWVTASRNGLSTAAVFFPGGTPSLDKQLADYTIGYGIEDAYSTQRKVSLSIADGWSDVPVSFSNPLDGGFTIQNVGQVFLYVIDSTDDNTQNYDTVILNTVRSGEEQAQTLKESEWGSLILLKKAFAGADFLIQNINAKTVTLYHTGVEHNTAAPSELLVVLNEKFGFFPPGGDSYALEHGWITDEDFMYEVELQSRYMAEVSAWVFETYHPDLMFTWQDPLDAAGHQFMMADQRQLNYSTELAERYQEYYNRAAEIVDSSLAIMLKAIDMKNTTIFVVGDHGMAPIHSIIYVNTVLEQAGLLTLDTQNNVVVSKTKAFAIASGGAVHIYINLVGREKGGGTVNEEDYLRVQQQIIDIFSSLKDPDTSQPVFERVLRKTSLAPLGLDHPNSGDVFAQAVPGYHLDGWRGNDYIFAQADFYGQHGYDSNLPEMHTIFIAAGFGVPGTGQIISPVKVVDYAPTIAMLLSFPPSRTIDGTIIPAFLQP